MSDDISLVYVLSCLKFDVMHGHGRREEISHSTHS